MAKRVDKRKRNRERTKENGYVRGGFKRVPKRNAYTSTDAERLNPVRAPTRAPTPAPPSATTPSPPERKTDGKHRRLGALPGAAEKAAAQTVARRRLSA